VERRYPDPASGPWALRVVVENVGGRPSVVGVELWAADRRRDRTPGVEREFTFPSIALDPQKPPVPITAEGVRLPLGRLLEEWKAENASDLKHKAEAFGPEVAEFYRELYSGLEGPAGRRPVYDRSFFQQVAEVYATAAARGDNPTDAVRKWKTVSKSTAAKWVSKARNELGLLPPTTRGKAIANKETDQ
jgi:hypothetical protein